MALRRVGWFSRIAHGASCGLGHPAAFLVAMLVIVLWAATGPLCGFSNTWQLVINTGTTIITFLMVFLIQNTQNRESQAVQLKLDELIRAVKGAHNSLLDLEELSDEELQAMREHFTKLAEQARQQVQQNQSSSTRTRTKRTQRSAETSRTTKLQA
jgi:low affinity Fe/Cu permease